MYIYDEHSSNSRPALFPEDELIKLKTSTKMSSLICQNILENYSIEGRLYNCLFLINQVEYTIFCSTSLYELDNKHE